MDDWPVYVSKFVNEAADYETDLMSGLLVSILTDLCRVRLAMSVPTAADTSKVNSDDVVPNSAWGTSGCVRNEKYLLNSDSPR
jgi:hypothetical protein